VKNLEGTSLEGVFKGAYTINDCEGTPDLILVGSGSEVGLCVDAKALMKDLKVSFKVEGFSI
jgi:transketolase